MQFKPNGDYFLARYASFSWFENAVKHWNWENIQIWACFVIRTFYVLCRWIFLSPFYCLKDAYLLWNCFLNQSYEYCSLLLTAERMLICSETAFWINLMNIALSFLLLKEFLFALKINFESILWILLSSSYCCKGCLFALKVYFVSIFLVITTFHLRWPEKGTTTNEAQSYTFTTDIYLLLNISVKRKKTKPLFSSFIFLQPEISLMFLIIINW